MLRPFPRLVLALSLALPSGLSWGQALGAPAAPPAAASNGRMEAPAAPAAAAAAASPDANPPAATSNASSASAESDEDPGTSTQSEPAFDLVIEAPREVRSLLERHLELRRYREVHDLDDAELARLITLAEQDARKLLGTLGYFSPQLRISRDTSGTRPRILVAVEPGPLTTIAEVEIGFAGHIATTTEPEPVEQRGDIRREWGLPAGQRFTQAGWDAAKSRALRDLTARRYLAGRIAHSRADIDAPANRAHLDVQLDSGPAYTLGELQVTGVERYDPRLVPRFSQLRPGQVYDREALVEAQLRLSGSGYFDSAFIHVDPAGDPDAVPVQVTVQEAPLQRLVLGVGFSTDAGPRASVEHTHNRLPAVGWRSVSKFNLNRKSPLAQVELTSIPDEDLWRWSTLARAERLEEGGLSTHSQRLRAGRFKSWDNIDRNYYLQYDHATAKPNGTVPVDPSDTGAGSAISANYVWTGRYFDDNLAPTGGFGLTAELGGGLTLGGDRSPFARVLGRGLFYRPLERGRLQLRAELGAVLARDSARLPATQLFRTGGDTTVRGYGYQEIGVDLPGGRVGPGRYVASGSVEWQRPIRRNGVETAFESLVFVDAGTVANRFDDLRPRVGLGGGARWRSPVGPLELALAYGVHPRKLRLHVNVGVTF